MSMLYQTRTLLGRTETCLYVCISFSGSNQRWFTLCRRPTPTPNPNPKPRWFTSCFRPCRILKNRTRKVEKKPSDNLMVSVPTRNFSTPPSRSARAVIGSNIYTIGECIDDDGFSSRVFFMDCRSHTWHEAPSMRIPQERSLASVLDGKIYVVDELKDLDSSHFIESFDPKTQKWEHVPGPSAEIARDSVSRILAMDGKLYLFGIDITVAYKPKENKWDVVELDMRLDLVDPESSCVIDNVTYSYMLAILKWYDSKGRLWRDLKGLEELPILPYTRVRLVNYGGKIAAFWGKKVRSAIGSDNKMIWCAVIAVERRNEHEVYGKIEWCDVVLTVPRSCRLLEFIAVNV